MRPVIDTLTFDQSMAPTDVCRLDIQKRIVAVMSPGDPLLSFANDLLRQMEQNAAVDNINDTLALYGNRCDFLRNHLG